jgi:FAD/FMN-containing dehydrogenase
MSSADRGRLWSIRDDIPALVAAVDTRLVYDVSLPIPAMAEYVATIESQLRSRLGAGKVIVFGHLGDGNLHVAVGDMTNDGPDAKTISDTIVYDALLPHGGSVSAEHGVGEFKKPYLDRSRTPAELAVMRSIKATLDPNGIMNPGKIF